MTGSWNDMTNPDAAGRMFILDDFEEAIGEANMINGFRLNTDEPDRARDLEGDPAGAEAERARVLDEPVQNLVSGLAVLHQAWNGDVVNVRNQVDNPEDFKYETCREGVPVGTDLMCIPVNARSPGTAMLFMDWILEPEQRMHRTSPGTATRCRARGQAGVREAGQGRAVDRRRPRRSSARAGSSTASVPRRTASSGPTIFTEVKAGVSARRGSGTGSCSRRGLAGARCSRSRAPRARALVRLRRRARPRRLLDFSLDNYGDAFDSVYIPVLLRSVGYAAATAALCLAIGYPIAYYIARYGGRHSNVLIAAAGDPVLRQLPRPHLRVGRAALRRRPRQQRRSRTSA